jgi:hypothetical protein
VRRILFIIVLALFMVGHAQGGVRLGLVSDGDPKPNAKAAYEWAMGRFNAQIIPLPKDKEELKRYGVVWWDESNGPSIPQPFLEKPVMEAFRGYVEDGGGLLLSSLAFHYIYDMGVESGQPRYFGRNDNLPLDWTDIAITKGQEAHPIFKGLKVENGIIQYDIKGWTEGSDFYSPQGPVGPKNGTLLAEVVPGHPQCNPLAEYSVGKGTILIIGWVWTAWVVNSHLEKVHSKLYENMINYLASKSLFAPVDPLDKLAVRWGEVKASLRR